MKQMVNRQTISRSDRFMFMGVLEEFLSEWIVIRQPYPVQKYHTCNTELRF